MSLRVQISFVSCVDNLRLYNESVSSSLSKQEGDVEVELIPIDNTFSKWSAPSALNYGLERAVGEIVVFCHQDVIFPPNWVNMLNDQISIVTKINKNWGVMGLFGITANGKQAGHVIDRFGYFFCPPLPCEVMSLDELCLIIRKSSGLRFDERLGGFHFYGADLCLQAKVKGLPNVAIDACVQHLGQGNVNEDFRNIAKKLYKKWSNNNDCPFPFIQTTCGIFKLKSGGKATIKYIYRRFLNKFSILIKRCFKKIDKKINIAKDNIIRSGNLHYFNTLRNDILAVIPSAVKCVLSVGCGCGVTEAELIKRNIKVVGIEINPEAAEMARKHGLIVLEGDALEIDISQPDDSFDCLVYADVLEHLPDPVAVLRRHVESLQTKGAVIVSVPNFRHYSIFLQLFVRGHIKYVDAGILDRTHLRITTRKMVLDWFDQVGIKPVSCYYHIHRRRHKLISACLGLAKEFVASQIICVGKKL